MFVLKSTYQNLKEELNYTRETYEKNLKKQKQESDERYNQVVKSQFTELDDLKRSHKHAIEDLERKHLKDLSQKDIEHAQEIKTLEYQLQDEYRAKVQREVSELLEKEKKLLNENHTTLQSSLKKLHEEGNASTKFMQELSIKTMELAKGLPSPVSVETNVNPALDVKAKKK